MTTCDKRLLLCTGFWCVTQLCSCYAMSGVLTVYVLAELKINRISS